MRFYGLSEQRVRHVINAPKRIEEGIAPKTVAMMQPLSIKGSGAKENWSQEIWVMLRTESQKKNGARQGVTKIISAWRYPGRTKPRSEIALDILRREFHEYLEK